MRHWLFISCLAFLFAVSVCSASEAADTTARVKSSSKLTYFRNSGPVFFSATAYSGVEALRKGNADKAYAVWVEEGLAGDFEAMAMTAALCAMEEKKPSAAWRIRMEGDPPPQPVCPVPARFWEDSLVSLLGEGEGTLLLGLFGMEVMEADPHRRKTDYAPMVEAYMLRSAHAGNAAGMYGAYLTGENRQAAFTSAQNLPELPILPDDPDATYEQRYWLTHAAHAGNWFAAESIGWANIPLNPDPQVTLEIPTATKYFTMAAGNGSSSAAHALQTLYAEGDFLPQNCRKSIYFGALGARLVGLGGFTSRAF